MSLMNSAMPSSSVIKISGVIVIIYYAIYSGLPHDDIKGIAILNYHFEREVVEFTIMAHPDDQEIQVPQPVADAPPEPNADIPVLPPGAQQEVNVLFLIFLSNCVPAVPATRIQICSLCCLISSVAPEQKLFHANFCFLPLLSMY